MLPREPLAIIDEIATIGPRNHRDRSLADGLPPAPLAATATVRAIYREGATILGLVAKLAAG